MTTATQRAAVTHGQLTQEAGKLDRELADARQTAETLEAEHGRLLRDGNTEGARSMSSTLRRAWDKVKNLDEDLRRVNHTKEALAPAAAAEAADQNEQGALAAIAAAEEPMRAAEARVREHLAGAASALQEALRFEREQNNARYQLRVAREGGIRPTDIGRIDQHPITSQIGLSPLLQMISGLEPGQ